mmetsp:Transcript_34081/g.39510  ORF Transcript_34081/g.39510 Transcript_34081/m.39510 type:complete len:154 (-) Transcript_34081:100-561(-)
MKYLSDIALQGKQLKPTATIVRNRDGIIKIEREELLTASETEEVTLHARRMHVKEEKIRDRLPVTVTPIRPRRLDVETERDEFLQYSEDEGYAVVARVAGPAEIEHTKDLSRKLLEGDDRGRTSKRGKPSVTFDASFDAIDKSIGLKELFLLM